MAQPLKKVDNTAEIDRLALLLAKEPGSKAFIPLAEEYGKAGMWQEAAGVLEDGLKAYPSFITAMVALGRAYEQLSHPVKAKAILEEAIKLSPDNLRAHRTLAKLYAVDGAREAALRSCQVILAVNPQDQEALSLRAGLMKAPEDLPQQISEQLDRKPSFAAESSSNESMTFDRTPSHAEEHQPHSNPHDTIRQTESIAVVGESIPDSTASTRSTVVRLEQWLHRVQTRRRDRRPTADSRS